MALIRDDYTFLAEYVEGTNASDLIIWSGAIGLNDVIDGGKGRDILSINANSDKFAIKIKKSGATFLNEISEYSYDEEIGNAVIQNIEKIEFLDKTITIPRKYSSTNSRKVIRDEYTYVDENITGTNGSDLIAWSGAKDQVDFIDGRGGYDVLCINSSSSIFKINKKKSGLTYINETSKDYDLKFGNATIKNIEKIEFLDKTISLKSNSGKSKLNKIIGTSKKDVLTGTKRSDQIKGGNGNDTIYGNAGNDVITGGKGKDILFGGKGRDKFVTSKKLGKGFKNADYIEDFEIGKDTLKITGSIKGLSLLNYKGDELVLMGNDDVIAWIYDAGGQLKFGGSKGNIVM